MPSPETDLLSALAAARAGSKEALGRLLEHYRNYLLFIAEEKLNPGLRPKGGASDLVQETFLEAQRDFANFQGNTEEELLAWLRQMLYHNLANFARRYRGTGKRQLAREVSLEAAAPPRHLRAELPAAAPSPSDRLIAREESRRVLDAVDRLPAEYGEVLRLRCQEECSFEEIGRRMNRSKNAAQKLWVRALERLEHELEDAS